MSNANIVFRNPLESDEPTRVEKLQAVTGKLFSGLSKVGSSLRRQHPSSQSSGSPTPCAGPPPAPHAPAVRPELKEQRMLEALSTDPINLPALRDLSSYGLPEKPGARALVWKILLGYLPQETGLWDSALKARREQYAQMCEELVFCPSKKAQEKQEATSDHPLSMEDGSVWNAYFADNELREQIERDVMRTHPEVPFFAGSDDAAVERRKAMERALFVHAKLNPSIKYVQGMNEIYAQLFYVYANDPDPAASKHAEADAFFCFMDLIAEVRDHFCQRMDDDREVGIKATMRMLSEMVAKHDAELWRHLVNVIKLDFHFFAFRWISLLLTQEFPLAMSLRVWDGLLAAEGPRRKDALLRTCAAMLINVREALLGADFSAAVKLLQRYPGGGDEGGVSALLSLSTDLRADVLLR